MQSSTAAAATAFQSEAEFLIGVDVGARPSTTVAVTQRPDGSFVVVPPHLITGPGGDFIQPVLL